MPDQSSDTAQSRSGSGQGRRRRNNRQRSRGEERTSSSSGGHFNVTRREPQQTGFQKFLSAVTFGLLGKPKPRAKVASPSASSSATTNTSSNKSSGGNNGRREERPAREARPPRQPREARHEPNPAEVTSDRLYVGNLSYDAAESDLIELFSGVGQVRSAEVVVNNRTQRSKGFAFVTMADIEQARRAVVELSNKEFMGRPLQVSGAKPPSKDRDESES